MHRSSLLAFLLARIISSQAAQTLIPTTCFSSESALESYFNYLYPWGSDHNGGARMDKAHIAISSDTLTLTAQSVTGQPSTKQGGKTIQINYLSGTVNAKTHFTVTAGGALNFSAQFQAPTAKGTWPAFWLTAVQGWPPEVDMAEWKGDGKISFNTFNTSSQVEAKDVTYSDPGKWHDVRAELRDENGKDVAVKFYLDGKEEANQVGKAFVGTAMYLIIDLQMEGSSGSPGPKSSTYF
ncbi:glycoside hydrolase family 16 protein [Glonium stellatum]|uniref:Glycoside hydrolase family 16 protein n=1 Tax=Glonium stellatum TaxID=574774 RepID=A0A8E2JLG4_9PEZI|nr:glycoside hydrolase family 16 protein [Glonium stellatum]